MVPCWATSPADRPRILDLYTSMVSLGAIPGDLARDEMQLTAVHEKPALGPQNLDSGNSPSPRKVGYISFRSQDTVDETGV